MGGEFVEIITAVSPGLSLVRGSSNVLALRLFSCQLSMWETYK